MESDNEQNDQNNELIGGAVGPYLYATGRKRKRMIARGRSRSRSRRSRSRSHRRLMARGTSGGRRRHSKRLSIRKSSRVGSRMHSRRRSSRKGSRLACGRRRSSHHVRVGGVETHYEHVQAAKRGWKTRRMHGGDLVAAGRRRSRSRSRSRSRTGRSMSGGLVRGHSMSGGWQYGGRAAPLRGGLDYGGSKRRKSHSRRRGGKALTPFVRLAMQIQKEDGIPYSRALQVASREYHHM